MAGFQEITDPSVLDQLNQQIGQGPFSPPKGYAPIADPDLLAQLNATAGVNNGAQPLITGEDAQQAAKHGLASGAVGTFLGIPDMATSINRFAARHVPDVDKWMVSHGLISQGELDKQDKAFAEKYGKDAAAQDLATGGKELPSTQDVVQGNLGIAPPTTPGGKALDNVVSFFPAAATGGSVASLVRNGLVPGLASEGAGQAADFVAPNSGAGDVARLLGGVYGQSKMAPTVPVGTPERIAQRAERVKTLEDAGVPVTAGQATGSLPLQQKENFLDPALAQKGQQGYTKAMMENITGQPHSGILDENSMKDMFDSFGPRYGNLPNYSLPADSQLVQELANHEQNHSTLGVSPDTDRSVKAMQDAVLNAAVKPGGITAQDYQTMRTNFGRQARNAQDPTMKSALLDMNGVLDNAMERGMVAGGAKPEELSDFRSLAGDYKNALVLEKAMNASKGPYLSPAAVDRAAKAVYGRQYTTGNTKFNKLNTAANDVLAPPAYDTAGKQEAKQSKLAEIAQFATKAAGAAAGHTLLPGVDPVFGLLMGEGLGNTVKSGVNAMRKVGTTSPLAQYLMKNQTGRLPGLLTLEHSLSEPSGQVK